MEGRPVYQEHKRVLWTDLEDLKSRRDKRGKKGEGGKTEVRRNSGQRKVTRSVKKNDALAV